jgi:N-acetylneuraminic acid mutarotase
VVEHGGLFYLFAGADSDSRTNDMYQFNPETRQWHQIFQATGDSHINNQMSQIKNQIQRNQGHGNHQNHNQPMNDQTDIAVHDMYNQSGTLRLINCQPKARSGTRAISYRDSLFFFGGYTRKGGTYFNDLF